MRNRGDRYRNAIPPPKSPSSRSFLSRIEPKAFLVVLVLVVIGLEERMMVAPAPGKGKEVVVAEEEERKEEEEEEATCDELEEQMEFLRRLDIGEEREQEAARWWRRREDAATTSGAAGWWRREDVATTSAAAANRRVVPAFGGVAMTPGRIWADGNAVAGPPAPTPPWTPRPRRHGGMLGDDRHARGGHVLLGSHELQVPAASASPSSSISRRAAAAANAGWRFAGADTPQLVVYLANNEQMVLHTLFHAPLNEAHLVAEVIVDHAADIMESIHGQRLLSCVLHNCCCELHEAIVAKITQHRDRFYRICVERHVHILHHLHN